MYCPHCGAILKQDAVFCNTCGHNLSKSKATNKKKKIIDQLKTADYKKILSSKTAIGLYVFIGFIFLLSTLLNQDFMMNKSNRSVKSDPPPSVTQNIPEAQITLDTLQDKLKRLNTLIAKEPNNYTYRIDKLLLENNGVLPDDMQFKLIPIFDIAKQQNRLQSCYNYLQQNVVLTETQTKWIIETYFTIPQQLAKQTEPKQSQPETIKTRVSATSLPQPRNFDEYFTLIKNRNFPINEKAWIKDDFIKNYFTSPAFNVKIQGGSSNTITGTERIDKFTESLSLGAINYTIVSKKFDESNKISELIVKHN
jgi:hypothetical protein